VQGGMGAMEVIVMKIEVEEGSAVVAGVIGPGISPLAGDGLDEALGLAVGLWSVGSGEGVLESELLAGCGKALGAVSGAAIGEHALYPDAMSFVEVHSLLEGIEDAGSLFIGEQAGEGEARMIIDGHVEGLDSGAWVAESAVAGGAHARPGEASELLDIEMEEFAGMIAFVADGRRLGRFQGGKPAEMVAAQHAGKGGLGNGQNHPDLGKGTAGATQLHDLRLQGGSGLAGLADGSAGTVLAPWLEAFLFGASEPFAHRLFADRVSGGGLTEREVLSQELGDHPGAHERGESGVSVHIVRAQRREVVYSSTTTLTEPQSADNLLKHDT
jgi:hypothetical protein